MMKPFHFQHFETIHVLIWKQHPDQNGYWMIGVSVVCVCLATVLLTLQNDPSWQ